MHNKARIGPGVYLATAAAAPLLTLSYVCFAAGQSQPPTYLSMFLEVCDPRAPSPDWTCFVSHRLAVVNQKAEAEKSVSKESQVRRSAEVAAGAAGSVGVEGAFGPRSHLRAR